MKLRKDVVGGIFLSAVTHLDKGRISLILCVSEYAVTTYGGILLPVYTTEFVTTLQMPGYSKVLEISVWGFLLVLVIFFFFN